MTTTRTRLRLGHQPGVHHRSGAAAGGLGLKGLQITESEEAPVVEEEDEEVDYDESKEALNDD